MSKQEIPLADDAWVPTDASRYKIGVPILAWKNVNFDQVTADDALTDPLCDGASLTVTSRAGTPKRARLTIKLARQFPWMIVTPVCALLGVVITQLVNCGIHRDEAATKEADDVVRVLRANGCAADIRRCLESRFKAATSSETQLIYLRAAHERFQNAVARLSWPCLSAEDADDCLGEIVTWRDRLSRSVGCPTDKDQAACIAKYVSEHEPAPITTPPKADKSDTYQLKNQDVPAQQKPSDSVP
jgi:hypothetical protein